MKRLLKSSNFWNAIIGTIFVVVAFRFTESELVVSFVGALFGVKALASGSSDFVKANKGIYYNEQTNREQYIKED